MDENIFPFSRKQYPFNNVFLKPPLMAQNFPFQSKMWHAPSTKFHHYKNEFSLVQKIMEFDLSGLVDHLLPGTSLTRDVPDLLWHLWHNRLVLIQNRGDVCHKGREKNGRSDYNLISNSVLSVFEMFWHQNIMFPKVLLPGIKSTLDKLHPLAGQINYSATGNTSLVFLFKFRCSF